MNKHINIINYIVIVTMDTMEYFHPVQEDR